MNEQFINKYVENLANELSKVQKEKVLVQTNLDLALLKVQELDKQINDLLAKEATSKTASRKKTTTIE